MIFLKIVKGNIDRKTFSLTFPDFSWLSKIIPWLSLTTGKITLFSLTVPDCDNPVLSYRSYQGICHNMFHILRNKCNMSNKPGWVCTMYLKLMKKTDSWFYMVITEKKFPNCRTIQEVFQVFPGHKVEKFKDIQGQNGNINWKFPGQLLMQ